jgi:thiol-disulfide isomerase/thioredoxin
MKTCRFNRCGLRPISYRTRVSLSIRVATILLFCITAGGETANAGAVIGTPFNYQIGLTDPDSAGTDLSYYKKKPLLVYYFSSTCGHCKQFFPRIIDLAKRMGKNLELVGIASGSVEWGSYLDFVKKNNDMRVLFDSRQVFPRNYGGEKVPNPMVVSPEGKILYWFDGINETVIVTLEQTLREMLGLPPFQKAMKPVYYGTLACKACHESIYWDWRMSPHAQAYRTLINRFSEKGVKVVEKSCEVCHTVGAGQPGGFDRTKNQGETFQQVGCENCHGKGCGWKKKATVTKAACLACHTAQWSPKFDFEAGIKAVNHPRKGEPPQKLEAEIKEKGL